MKMTDKQIQMLLVRLEQIFCSKPLTQREIAIRQLKSEIEVGIMFGCPKEFAMGQAIKQVKEDTGVDFSYLLGKAIEFKCDDSGDWEEVKPEPK